MSKFEFGLNPIWLLPCVFVALGFSLFLYFKFPSVWNKKWNLFLAALRFFGVFLLLFLLLNSVIRSIENTIQVPKIQVLIDNSQSLILADKDVKSKFNEALKKLQQTNTNLDIEFFDFSKKIENIDSLSFDESVTDFSKSLKNLENISAGENHVATILLSDGIVNQGTALKNIVSPKPIYVLACGDSIVRKDLILSELYVNKSTYKGNEFPVQAGIKAIGFAGQRSKVNFLIDGQLISSKEVVFKSDNELIDLGFLYTSKKASHLKITCQVQSLSGEFNVLNNSKTKYIQVKDGRKKVAIIAASPHPDLKAIKTSIEKLDKYEVSLVILSLNKKMPDFTAFDSFILHQIPCKSCSSEVLNKILSLNKPKWFITGIQSDFVDFNKINNALTLTKTASLDLVSGRLNDNFDLFSIEEFDFDFLAHAPPIQVPYAQIDLKAGTQVLFYQMVGSTSNGKPLFAYNNNKDKEFITLGEGIWKWKLFEFLENGNNNNFDLLISKIIGLMDNENSETRFEVIVQKENYLDFEKPNFSVNSRNELGELVYNNEIELQVKRNDTLISKTNFMVSETEPFYALNTLSAGVYTYFATTKIGTQKYVDKGVFSVSDLQLESKDLTADFEGLRTLAKNSKGGFYFLNDVNYQSLSESFKSFSSKIMSNEKERFLNDIFWILGLILLIFSVEWIARKLLGDV